MKKMYSNAQTNNSNGGVATEDSTKAWRRTLIIISAFSALLAFGNQAMTCARIMMQKDDYSSSPTTTTTSKIITADYSNAYAEPISQHPYQSDYDFFKSCLKLPGEIVDTLNTGAAAYNGLVSAGQTPYDEQTASSKQLPLGQLPPGQLPYNGGSSSPSSPSTNPNPQTSTTGGLEDNIDKMQKGAGGQSPLQEKIQPFTKISQFYNI